MNDSYRNKVLINVGRVLMVLALIYFVRRLLPHLHTIGELLVGYKVFASFLLGVFIYSVALAVLSLLWTVLLSMIGGHLGHTRASHALVYLLTIIAKYIPGNVFQYATRHILTKKLGLSHRAIALAAVAELAILSASAVLLSILVIAFGVGAPNFASLMPWEGWDRWVTPIWMIAITVAIGGLSIAGAYFFLSGSVLKKCNQLLAGYGLASMFFIISFVALWVVARLFIGAGEQSTISLLTYLFVANIVAWLIGMLTPGAPGGLGVREVVFLALLAPLLGEPQALSIAVASRLITLAGDGLVSLVAYIATKKRPLFNP